MARRLSAAVKDEPTVLDGKSSAKLRKARAGDITDAQIETFFATLVETCNVVRSAKAAGVSANWMYRKRQSDAGFRAAWAEAVREGYARLELVLLERAMKGTPKLVRTAKGTDRVMRDYPNSVAIALLKRHSELAETAGFEPDPAELKELKERILERLERVRERDGGACGGPPPPLDASGDERSPSLRRHSTGALGPAEPGSAPRPSRGGLIETKAARPVDAWSLDQRIALLRLALGWEAAGGRRGVNQQPVRHAGGMPAAAARRSCPLRGRPSGIRERPFRHAGGMSAMRSPSASARSATWPCRAKRRPS